MRVLVVEDDPDVGDALVEALRHFEHEASLVRTGADALLRHHDADLLLLDLQLLDGDGFEVLRRLRAVSAVPVLVVTARTDERSAVRALRLGADDFVNKPVRLGELLARMEAVMRRRRPAQSAEDLVVSHGISVDLQAREVTRDGEPVSLTTKEFELLAALARRCGRAVSRQQILDEVWGDAYVGASRSFDVHLTQLRAKLSRPELISTIRGFGYRMER